MSGEIEALEYLLQLQSGVCLRCPRSVALHESDAIVRALYEMPEPERWLISHSEPVLNCPADVLKENPAWTLWLRARRYVEGR